MPSASSGAGLSPLRYFSSDIIPTLFGFFGGRRCGVALPPIVVQTGQFLLLSRRQDCVEFIECGRPHSGKVTQRGSFILRELLHFGDRPSALDGHFDRMPLIAKLSPGGTRRLPLGLEDRLRILRLVTT